MRSERLARALLRLYPRAWRERYGEEFVALATDAGLGVRGSLDVLAAAFLERLRWLAAVYRREVAVSGLASEERIAMAALVVVRGALFGSLAWLTGRALFAAGLPQPFSGQVWFFIVAAVMARAMYSTIRFSGFNTTWPGLHRHEIHALEILLFVSAVAILWPRPSGQDYFLLVAMLSTNALELLRDNSRAGVIRRRAVLALQEELIHQRYLEHRRRPDLL